jgi:ferric-dicitrate binding protein FerR (iron transport regulator)
MPDGIELTPEQKRRRRARSIAIALALGAMVVLFFVITLVKIGGNIASRAM